MNLIARDQLDAGLFCYENADISWIFLSYLTCFDYDVIANFQSKPSLDYHLIWDSDYYGASAIPNLNASHFSFGPFFIDVLPIPRKYNLALDIYVGVSLGQTGDFIMFICTRLKF